MIKIARHKLLNGGQIVRVNLGDPSKYRLHFCPKLWNLTKGSAYKLRSNTLPHCTSCLLKEGRNHCMSMVHRSLDRHMSHWNIITWNPRRGRRRNGPCPQRSWKRRSRSFNTHFLLTSTNLCHNRRGAKRYA